MNRYRCVEVYYAGQIDRAEMKPDEAGAYVLYEDHARSLAEEQKRLAAERIKCIDIAAAAQLFLDAVEADNRVKRGDYYHERKALRKALK